MHMEQSLVGKVLSSCVMAPPMDGLFSTMWTLKPLSEVHGGLDPGDAAADHDHGADLAGHHAPALEAAWTEAMVASR